jgi:uncharacterized protein YcbK (DUF882 family)
MRWLTLLLAASALSGCVASTFDSAASFAPDDSATAGFAFGADDSIPVPRPVEDVAAASTEADFAQDEDGDEVLTALESSEAAPIDAPLMETASTDIPGQFDGTDLQIASSSDLEATAGSEELVAASTEPDLATQRINAASGTTETHRIASIPAPVTAQERRSGGLLSLFSNKRATPARNAVTARPATSLPEARRAPVVTVAPAQSAARPVIAVASASGSGALPGFDRNRALGVNTASETDDEEDFDGPAPIQLASAAGLARLAPNGLNVQHSGVDVACLKPALVRVLKQIEGHYGRSVVVTSGYRGAGRNKRARGAKNSLHIYCSAADIQVEDVSKWELAAYLRSMPGRGGVGTYCHTNSVHVDIGPQRDWNWRCRRRK